MANPAQITTSRLRGYLVADVAAAWGLDASPDATTRIIYRGRPRIDPRELPYAVVSIGVELEAETAITVQAKYTAVITGVFKWSDSNAPIEEQKDEKVNLLLPFLHIGAQYGEEQEYFLPYVTAIATDEADDLQDRTFEVSIEFTVYESLEDDRRPGEIED